MSWPLVKLDNYIDILSGFAFKSSLFGDAGLPLIRIRDVVRGNSNTYYSGEYSGDYIIRKGDLLVGMDGDFNREYWKSEDALLNQRVCKLTADGSRLDQAFLYHLLPKELINIHRNTPAVTVKHLSVTKIRDIEIPLPPLAEQKRIAAILDKADAIRRKRQQAIQLSDDFLRAVFLDMFGDIPAKKSDYLFKGCRGFVTASSGKSSKTVLSSTPTQIPIYGGNGINGYATQSLYGEPVIVVGRVGQQCAITNITNGPSWVTDNAIVIKVTDTDVYNPFYLTHAFQHSPIRDIVTHLDLPFINQTMILDTPIPLPPIEFQNKFALIREKAIKNRELLSHFATQSETCFFSLSQKAFAGEL